VNVVGDLYAGQRQNGRAEVDEAHQPVAHSAGRLVVRVPHEQRNARARIVYPSLRSRQPVAVIAEEEDDRVVGQAIVFELLEDRTDLDVQGGDVVVVFGQIRPDGPVRRRDLPCVSPSLVSFLPAVALQDFPAILWYIVGGTACRAEPLNSYGNYQLKTAGETSNENCSLAYYWNGRTCSRTAGGLPCGRRSP